MRYQFGVRLKDLALKKRYECEANLVCVPDAILKRNCNADVYSVGILLLQLVVGIDLMKTTEKELRQVQTFTLHLTAELMNILALLFSGSVNMQIVFEQTFFTSIRSENLIPVEIGSNICT